MSKRKGAQAANFDSQLRLSEKMKKTRSIKAKQMSMEVDVSHLPMSSEMEHWLSNTFVEDNEGLLPESVASVLAPPLDSMGLYTPVGAIAVSAYAAVKPEESLNDKERRRRWEQSAGEEDSLFNQVSMSEASFHSATDAPSLGGSSMDTGMMSTSTTWSLNKVRENRPAAILKDDAMTRMEVLWMQQRAKIELEEGEHDKAMDTLKAALELELGPSNEYKDANLGDPTFKDAGDLYQYVTDQYRDYDKTAHFDAGKIQRCYLRWVRNRSKRANYIQKIFRGFMVRNASFEETQRMIQTVQIIQRRYRKYLKMLFDCSDLIKFWYQKLKLMEEFKSHQFWYRKAYRIQRLYRGYDGRQVAFRKRKELLSTNLIQRQSRAWRLRHQRSQAIRLVHRRYHKAAVVIQCKIRYCLSVRHAQIQLLREFAREEDRLEREEAIVEEAVNVSLKKSQLYMQTEAGRMHKEVSRHRINLKDRLFKKNKANLSDEEVMAQEALVSFELFDRDGSGRIDEDELADMLVQLAIPADEETVKKLAVEIDTDGGGDIDFGEFLEWYTGGGSSEVEANASLEDRMFKQLLRARTYVLEVSGFILQRRAERDILRQCTSWLSKDTAATFRMSHHPKFQCCHCMEPFVMFADYEDHFDVVGQCKATGNKAIYYPKYWKSGCWTRQREVEWELRRLNDELPNVNYYCVTASFLEMSLQHDPGVSQLLHEKTRKAQVIYMEKRHGKQGDGDGGGEREPVEILSMSEEIMNVVNICGDGHLSPLIAMCVAGRLGGKVPDEWILEDDWDMEKLREWVTERVDGEKGISKRKPKIPLCYQDEQILKEQTWLLADIYVRVVRLLQVAAEASLLALMDFRSRRPRVLTIPDAELEEVGLANITKKEYLRSRDVILGRLNVCNAAIERLCLIQVADCCDALLKKAGGKVQVGPDGKLSKEEMHRLSIEDAHIISLAKYRARLRSKIGSTQLHRLTSELWALHKEYKRDGVKVATSLYEGEITIPAAQGKKAGDATFLYEILANEVMNEGIDMWDVDLLERNLNMTVTDAKMPAFKESLDPEDSGYITFRRFLPWLLQSKEGEYFSVLKGASKLVGWTVMSLLSSYYYVHAEDKLLSNIRTISRLEMNYRSKSIEALLLGAELALTQEGMKEADEKAAALENMDPDSMGVITSTAELEEASKTPMQRLKEKEEREAKSKQTKEDMVKSTELLESLKEEVEVLAHKMTEMKHADDEGESLLLYRLAMNEARENCVEGFTTKTGFYSLLTEMLLITSMETMVDAMGSTIPRASRYPWTATMMATSKDGGGTENGNQQVYETGWSLALQQVVYAFDTDCSGGFDEGEVSLLLSCSNCGLSERRILSEFPEVMDDAANVHTLSGYLAPKVMWGRGLLWRLGWGGSTSLLMKPRIVSAASMLMSLSMQRARAAAEEATALTRTGQLQEEEEEKNEEAIMTRAQMFAMRQVVLFMRTVQGRQKLRWTKKDVKYWWKQDIWHTGASRQGLFNYAYMLHKDHRGVLITELPHVIRFLTKHCGFSTAPAVRAVAVMVYAAKTKDAVRWLGQAEVLQLLEASLAHTNCVLGVPSRASALTLGRLWNVRRDAIINIESRARQQSVMISLRFEGIFVADTNYRCSALGLNDVIKEISANATWGIYRPKPKVKLDWRNVPREAFHFLLLSHGYSLDDMKIDGFDSVTEIDHRSGGIAVDTLLVPDALLKAKDASNAAFTGYTGYLQKARRWGNYITNATGGAVAYWHYFRISKAIMTESKKVNVQGAKYLREIITGQSHCVTET
jgi:hypothetical protein